MVRVVHRLLSLSQKLICTSCVSSGVETGYRSCIHAFAAASTSTVRPADRRYARPRSNETWATHSSPTGPR